MDRPWLVISDVISNPERVIKEFGQQLWDLREGCSEGESRIADGRSIADPEIEQEINQALRRASETTSITYAELEPLRLLRYSVGGHYSWHADNELVDEEHRKLSAVIALNDDYEGGNTEFMWPRPGRAEVVHLDPGSAVIFPAFMYHRALPVTGGTRWVVTAWTIGDSFR